MKKEADDTDGEKDADPRLKKVTKAIGEIEYEVEEAGTLDSNEVKFQKTCADATVLARNLANTRGSVADPAYMEEQIRELVAGSDKCTLEVLDGAQLLEQGMGLFHAVGRGADIPPRCVIVNYRGDPDSTEVEIALIGKGVTYDTGGLNLKPTGFMEDMYGDKGGSCAVIGAL